MSEREPIGVVGAGWVGLVTAACFAELGHQVVVREILPEKVESLRAGEVPIYEPGLAELIEKNGERLNFTLDMDELLDAARLIFICVETPPTHSGDADLRAVMRAVEEIGEGGERALVMKSTVPVGTGRTISKQAPGLAYISCPEFLREGTAVKDFMNPDRVVIGAGADDQWAGDAVAAIYDPLGAPIVRTDVSSAEMIKLASNAFLATKISFINEIANVCDETGADVTEVARGMGMDDRIGPKFLHAGIGYGGSCFPKDTQALKMLAGNIGYHFQLLSSVIEVNELQKRRVTAKLSKHLGSLEGKRIAILGLAFKPDTDDMREASSLVLAARLQGEGASVVAFDPIAAEAAGELLPDVEMSDTALDALDGADAAVLVTEWPQFGALDWAEVASRMANPLIVDGRNFLDAETVRAAGMTYEGIGRPSEVGRESAKSRLMQALILAGGAGTRLRPLTNSVAKPVLPLVGRPHIAYVIDWLARHGVDDAVISCGHLAEGVRSALPEIDGVEVSYAEEPDARGTAGAIRFAEEHLAERFLVLNGDILCDLDLSAMIAQHEETGARATIALHPVEDPSAYGLVRRGEDNAITDFLEKPDPDEIDTDEINAGAYLLERSVLDLIPPDQEVSIEREVFPKLVGEGLYGRRLEGYWIDIGTPERFRQANWDILEGKVETKPGDRIGEGAQVADSATIGARAVIGAGSEIGEDALIEESVLLDGCRVGGGAELREAILAAGVEIAPGTALEPGSVIGEGELVGGAAA